MLPRCLLLLALVGMSLPASTVELTGLVGLELRGFLHSPQHPGQRPQAGSVFVEPELYWSDATGRNSVLFTPFLRILFFIFTAFALAFFGVFAPLFFVVSSSYCHARNDGSCDQQGKA